MATEQRAAEQEPSFLDEPWLRRQVETHLIFGLFARRLDFGWVLISLPLVLLVSALGESWGLLLGKTVTAGLFVFFFRLTLRMSRYRQAAFGWCVTKATLAMGSFLFLLGSLVNFFRGEPDAIDLMLLGFIWFPGVEFASSIVSRQRYLTIARLLLSVLIIFLGMRAGRWT